MVHHHFDIYVVNHYKYYTLRLYFPNLSLLTTGPYLSIMDFLRGQYVIYGPVRIILIEDEV